MTKRTLAALAALLVAASTLTVIAAAPAGAHGVSVRRCAYDPFAGNQCWNETSYNHPHTPVQRNLTCGEGMLGTYPNCYPAPSTNENHDPNADKDDDSGGGGDSGGGDDSEGDDSGGDDSGTGGSGGAGTGGTTTTTTSTDPCGDWANAVIAAVNKNNDGTGTYTAPPAAPAACKGSTTNEMFNKIKSKLAEIGRKISEYQGEAVEGEREATEQAYEDLRKALKAAWNYEVPGYEYLDATNEFLLCAGVVAIYVRTKGKAAKIPGWTQVVAGLGCTNALVALEIHYRDPGTGSSGGSGSGGGSQQPTPDPNDPDGDYDGDGTTSREELKKADQKLWDEEITDEEYMRIWRKYACDQGDTHECR